jgi:hypothetical protein
VILGARREPIKLECFRLLIIQGCDRWKSVPRKRQLVTLVLNDRVFARTIEVCSHQRLGRAESYRPAYAC